MRKLLYILLFIAALLPSSVAAQRMTTMGTDFWLSFLYNHTEDITGIVTKHRIFVSGANNCSVTVSNPNTGWSTTQSVVPGQVTTIEVPMQHSENTVSESVVNKGIHVTSTDTVSVYSSTISASTYDVANIIPTAALRDDYIMQSYPSDKWGCVCAVVATENNTTVDIVLTDPTSNGHSAGDTITVLLPNAGNVYQVFQTFMPNNNGATFRDFTGTRIRSRDCKPIAVFNGDVCVYIPYFTTGQTCDLAYEQSIPTAYWGRKFVVPRLSTVLPDYVRVTALRDSTLVSLNSVTPVVINSGESYDYQIYSGVGDIITSSAPVSVSLYFASYGIHGSGDPSMLTINPIEQMIDNVTLASYSTAQTNIHRVNVILRTADKALFTLDGVSHPNDFYMIPNDATYSSAIFTVTAGSHTLNMGGNGKGFVAHAFGMGLRESYAYSVGSKLESLDNTLYVNGNFVTNNGAVNGCIGDTFSFAVHHEADLNFVVWDMDGTFLVGDSVIYSFPGSGQMHVTAHLGRTDVTCFSEDDTLNVYVNINGLDTTMMDTTVCNMPFTWYGNVYSEPDTLTHILQNRHGCDSLLLLNLELSTQGQDTTIIDTVVCRFPFTWYGNQYMEPDTLEHHLQNSQGCDSLLLLNLELQVVDTVIQTIDGCDSVFLDGEVFHLDTVVIKELLAQNGCDSVVVSMVQIHPSYYRVVRDSINQYDTLLWVDGGRYWQEDQHPEMRHRTIYGCDSIVRLSLTVIPYEPPPAPDSSRLWIPNCFTPDEETNSVFKVVSSEMEELHVTIFTRWGLYVSDFDGLTGSWDGTYKGEKCKQETYVYLIEYRTKTMPSVVQERVGTIMLLR